jgi:hypothetical protein
MRAPFVLTLLLVSAGGAFGDPSEPARTTAAYLPMVASGNLVGTTITNFGFLGNNFASREPSLEIPLGSGYEHMVQGGLWIGAMAIDRDGYFPGVTTGCLDLGVGSPPQAFTEFTPLTDITLRSRRQGSPYYDPHAVSDLDYVCEYDDLTRVATSNPEPHRPINVHVSQRNYSWSYGDYAQVFFYHFSIRNMGVPLHYVWVGLHTQLASGDRNDYSCWPPAQACGASGGWYKKALLAYEDSLRLLREEYCAGLPAPLACQTARVSCVGIKLLGKPKSWWNQKVTIAAWRWNPGDTTRDQDAERYALMSAGTIHDLTQPDVYPQTGDPSELIAVGPFPAVGPQDSVTVDFALVGGSDETTLRAHARAAQAVFDAGYVAPPPVAAVRPSETGLGIAGSLPSPARGALTVAFSLASAEPATLELYDLGGRRVIAREVGSFGAGTHALRLDRDQPLVPGAYFIRLAQGGRVVAGRAVVVR